MFASGTGTKIIELARRIIRLVERRSQIKMLPPDERGVTRFVANVQRMREMLRLDPPLDPLAHLPDPLPPGLRRYGLEAGALAAG